MNPRGGAEGEFDRIAEWANGNLPQLYAEATRIRLTRTGRGPYPLYGGMNSTFSVTPGKGWCCPSRCGIGRGVEFVRRMRFPELSEQEGRLAAPRELAPRGRGAGGGKRS